MTADLNAIVALNATLIELSRAHERLDDIPDWMQDLHEEHSQKQAEIDAVAAVADEAERERREAEATLGDSQEKLSHYQQQISSVSTQREYGALLKEIDTVKQHISRAEKQALEALERIDEASRGKEELQESFRELDERYRAELGKWESEKPAVATAIEGLTERSERLRAEVPRGTLILFDRIFGRYDGQALARVLKLVVGRGKTMWHCEACSFNVRPQIVVEIRTDQKLHQCDSCKRFLYLEAEE